MTDKLSQATAACRLLLKYHDGDQQNSVQLMNDYADAVDAARAFLATSQPDGVDWHAEYRVAQEHAEEIDDLCVANARALFRALHPGEKDGEIEREQSHEITCEAIARLTSQPDRPQAEGLDLSALVTDEAVDAARQTYARLTGLTVSRDLRFAKAWRAALEAALPLLLAAVRKNV